MKILFFTENYPPEVNASASRVHERACYWKKWGHEVAVITTAPNFPQGKVYPGYKNRWYQVENMDGIRVVRVKTFIAPNKGTVLRTLDFISFMLTSMIAGLFGKKPDVVVATSPQFFTAVGAYFVAAIRRVPFVFELGDLWPASIAAVGAMKEGFVLRQIERLELFLYRRAAKVVALTQSFKDDLVKRGIPASKIHVVINGVELSKYQPAARDEELLKRCGLNGKFVVGYIGTHGMAHGLENVLHAARQLRDVDNVCFLFVGDGAAKQTLVEEAARSNLKNVMFLPLQPKNEISRYWSLCDVALIHLRDNPVFETVIPSKAFEAMGMGLPILCAGPTGEISRIVEGEEAGICVSSATPEGIKEMVIRMRDDKELLRRLAVNSRNAAPRYSREKQAKDMIEVLEDVVNA